MLRTVRSLGSVCRSRSAFSHVAPRPWRFPDAQLCTRSSSGSTSSQAGDKDFQPQCNVLVVGGGGMGSSVAYWLKRKAGERLNVVVVERDLTYTQASTVLSVGGVRQQFSLPENIQMSLFGSEFIRNVEKHLGDVNLNYMPHGYLILASEKSAEILQQNSRLQNELGARNELLTPERLSAKFPWLCTDGVALGCYGLDKEGWFDPWALLMGFKNKAKELGAHFINGNLINFECQSDTIDKAIIQTPDGGVREMKFDSCVLAAGACSGEIARLAQIGTGSGALSVALPVEPRKRYVYVFNTQGENAPGIGTPITFDPNGTYFRRDGMGANYIAGCSPCEEEEPSVDNLEVDHEFFDTLIWPTLAQRVKAFESIKLCGSWAGFYEYNTFDENGIIGPHTHYKNLYIATGFSGHGIQQTPAVGRAISELILDGRYKTIDLSRLGFERIAVDRPMLESNIF